MNKICNWWQNNKTITFTIHIRIFLWAFSVNKSFHSIFKVNVARHYALYIACFSLVASHTLATLVLSVAYVNVSTARRGTAACQTRRSSSTRSESPWSPLQPSPCTSCRETSFAPRRPVTVTYAPPLTCRFKWMLKSFNYFLVIEI